jgi:hypothetical protein
MGCGAANIMHEPGQEKKDVFFGMASSTSSIWAFASDISSNWLISKKEDWVWVLGGAAASYLILAAFVAGFPVKNFPIIRKALGI